MSWNDERVESLSKLWLEGRSASQIAAELGLGITRNAVIGKVHRLGLAGRTKPAAAVQSRGKPKLVTRPVTDERSRPDLPYQAVVTPLKIPVKPYLTPVQQATDDVVIPFSERVTIMDLRESSCRWPMGDPTSAEFRFCGVRTGMAGGPYCTAHARMAFQPAPDRRRERVERYARIA
jgi:GcrA cell cycle regulator